ncbi:type II toxin-antitoxin system VapC family toxin [Palleronia sp.]|uniref:type II toxin-antitoxin system VapC family toxin n=1 Tax=Palleronia sp. TaxID=1940284 RepID=UPI0035C84C8A
MYLIDTNVISAARRPERTPRVAAWLKGQSEETLFLSAVTIGEISRGIRLQERRNPYFAADLSVWLERTTSIFADRILPVTAGDAAIWGRLSADLGHSGADLMIAAQALARGWTVVTGNVSDFTPTGVAVEDPF